MNERTKSNNNKQQQQKKDCKILWLCLMRVSLSFSLSRSLSLPLPLSRLFVEMLVRLDDYVPVILYHTAFKFLWSRLGLLCTSMVLSTVVLWSDCSMNDGRKWLSDWQVLCAKLHLTIRLCVEVCTNSRRGNGFMQLIRTLNAKMTSLPRGPRPTATTSVCLNH